jgi:hypothetical protein
MITCKFSHKLLAINALVLAKLVQVTLSNAPHVCKQLKKSISTKENVAHLVHLNLLFMVMEYV